MKQLMILLIAGSTLLLSCSAPKPIEFKRIETINPKLRMGTTVDLQLGIRVNNPNSFAVDIFDVTGECQLNGNYAGQLRLDSLQRLPANSETILAVTANIDYKSIAQSGAKLILEGGLPYVFRGEATAGRGKYKKTFPISDAGTLKRDILEKIFSPF